MTAFKLREAADAAGTSKSSIKRAYRSCLGKGRCPYLGLNRTRGGDSSSRPRLYIENRTLTRVRHGEIWS